MGAFGGRRVQSGVFRRWMVASLLVVGALVAGTGVALAVSGGGYSPAQQDCSNTADRNNTVTRDQQGNVVSREPDQPGCHNAKVNVEGDDGTRYAEVGTDQLPDGYPSTPGLLGVGQPGSPNFPHSGCAAVNTAGTGGGAGGPGTGCGSNPAGAGVNTTFDAYDPASTSVTPQTGQTVNLPAGVQLYMGADDNLDAGEHDGVDSRNGTAESANGPSDGGAVSAHVSPTADPTPSATNPVPVAGAGEGFCADGICQDVTTYQQTVYRGNPGTNDSRDVANYDGKQFDPYGCSSGSNAEEQACQTQGHGTMNAWRNAEAHSVNAEPGVQVYEDPDPQASPIDPVHESGATGDTPLYPLPGVYAGTCGVIAGGGSVPAPPAGVPQNGAGQVVVSSGC